MIKTKKTKGKPARYQYQYDTAGKTIGVFIPIKEWKAISKRYKGLSDEPVTKQKEKIKKDITAALNEVQKHTQGETKLQNAKDFIREMRKELK
jgi:hypothetical protein